MTGTAQRITRPASATGWLTLARRTGQKRGPVEPTVTSRSAGAVRYEWVAEDSNLDSQSYSLEPFQLDEQPMVPPAGFEPATSRPSSVRLCQLGYDGMVPGTRFELALSAF